MASFLVTTHAIAIKATVFIALGAIQLSATALILVYTVGYANSYCARHLPAIALAETTTASAPEAPQELELTA